MPVREGPPATFALGRSSSSTRKRKWGETRTARTASWMPRSKRSPSAIASSTSPTSLSSSGRSHGAAVGPRREPLQDRAGGVRIVSRRRRLAEEDPPVGFGPVHVPSSTPATTIARDAICSAAARYRSIRSGGIPRTSPTLSKPYPTSSEGKSSAGRIIHPDQVAYRIVVFGTIEAADGHAARIGRLPAIVPVESQP